MKNKTINPTRSQLNILRQICNFIPPNEVSKIARATGVQDKSRSFKPWSHVVSLVYAQLTHSIGLNDLCDSLQLHSGPLASIRGATAASRNGLSNANRERPAEMCAGIKSGEIALFDKGYVDFGHLRDLDERGVFWVTRAKDNLAYEVVQKMPQSRDEKILRDEVIVLSNPNKPAPELMRRVVALVEIDGEEREMVFLTNNLEWSPRSVADLYRCRWQI